PRNRRRRHEGAGRTGRRSAPGRGDPQGRLPPLPARGRDAVQPDLRGPPMTHGLVFRRATPADAPRMEAIRAAAFASVFASFRAILGDKLYALVQARDDEAQ